MSGREVVGNIEPKERAKPSPVDPGLEVIHQVTLNLKRTREAYAAILWRLAGQQTRLPVCGHLA